MEYNRSYIFLYVPYYEYIVKNKETVHEEGQPDKYRGMGKSGESAALPGRPGKEFSGNNEFSVAQAFREC
jgi:hypothetical protein